MDTLGQPYNDTASSTILDQIVQELHEGEEEVDVDVHELPRKPILKRSNAFRIQETPEMPRFKRPTAPPVPKMGTHTLQRAPQPQDDYLQPDTQRKKRIKENEAPEVIQLTQKQYYELLSDMIRRYQIKDPEWWTPEENPREDLTHGIPQRPPFNPNALAFSPLPEEDHGEMAQATMDPSLDQHQWERLYLAMNHQGKLYPDIPPLNLEKLEDTTTPVRRPFLEAREAVKRRQRKKEQPKFSLDTVVPPPRPSKVSQKKRATEPETPPDDSPRVEAPGPISYPDSRHPSKSERKRQRTMSPPAYDG